MEQLGSMVKVFNSGAKGPGSIPSRAQKFVSIAAHSITASDLWGQVQWMTKTSQSVPIRVMPDCLYTP